MCDGGFTMSDDEAIVSESGISRRDALKRGAALGGAVLWVTPIVQNIAISPAGAQRTSPPNVRGPSISFVDLRFTCGATVYYAKLENITGTGVSGPGAEPFVCEGPPSAQGRKCVEPAGAVSACNLGLFEVVDIVRDPEGDLVSVTVALTAACSGQITGGGAKCGNNPCHPGVVSPNGRSITFTC